MSSSVYVILRTDYESKKDYEGRMQMIAMYASLERANSAAEEHVRAHNKLHGLKDPNTKSSAAKDGTKGFKVIVGEEDYHSFDVQVYMDEVIGGTVAVTESPDADVKAEKDAPAVTDGGAKKGAKGNKGAKRDAGAEPAQGTRTSKRGKKES